MPAGTWTRGWAVFTKAGRCSTARMPPAHANSRTTPAAKRQTAGHWQSEHAARTDLVHTTNEPAGSYRQINASPRQAGQCSKACMPPDACKHAYPTAISQAPDCWALWLRAGSLQSPMCAQLQGLAGSPCQQMKHAPHFWLPLSRRGSVAEHACPQAQAVGCANTRT